MHHILEYQFRLTYGYGRNLSLNFGPVTVIYIFGPVTAVTGIWVSAGLLLRPNFHKLVSVGLYRWIWLRLQVIMIKMTEVIIIQKMT